MLPNKLIKKILRLKRLTFKKKWKHAQTYLQIYLDLLHTTADPKAPWEEGWEDQGGNIFIQLIIYPIFWEGVQILYFLQIGRGGGRSTPSKNIRFSKCPHSTRKVSKECGHVCKVISPILPWNYIDTLFIHPTLSTRFSRVKGNLLQSQGEPSPESRGTFSRVQGNLL